MATQQGGSPSWVHGLVTEAYKADREQVIRRLNEVLADELRAILAYQQFYYLVVGPFSPHLRDLFRKLSQDEMKHAEDAAERIVALGGVPTTQPTRLSELTQQLARSGLSQGTSKWEDMVRMALQDEQDAIRKYSEFVRFLGFDDIVTRRMIEDFLADEEGHANDLQNLLD